MSTYYKVTMTIELLMDEEPPEEIDIEMVRYEMTDGRWSGVMSHKVEEISPKEMAKALIDQGSDPEFLDLDEDGNEIDPECRGLE